MFCMYRNAKFRNAKFRSVLFGTVHFDNKEIPENSHLYDSILNVHPYFIQYRRKIESLQSVYPGPHTYHHIIIRILSYPHTIIIIIFAHYHIIISAHYHIIISAHYHIIISAHYHIIISAHYHIIISAHYHIIISAHYHINIARLCSLRLKAFYLTAQGNTLGLSIFHICALKGHNHRYGAFALSGRMGGVCTFPGVLPTGCKIEGFQP